MTLRARLSVLTAAAVALTVVATSVTLWLLIRASLMHEVDRRLLDRTPNIDRIAQLTIDRPPGAVMTTDVRFVVQNEPMGIQVIGPDGSVTHELAPGDIELDLDAAERALLDGGEEGAQLRTVTIDEKSYRLMSATLSSGGAIRLFQPLAGVEATMTRIAWILAGVAGVGVALAGGLGWVTARAGLRPVDKLVAAAEQVAATKDLAHRLAVTGSQRDEVARLAASVNAMLAALDSARIQQRELVENAGHELRTPLTTLRNDLGLLLRAEQQPNRTLTPEERAGLLRELESEAAALSKLIGEVIDLARGDIEPEPSVEADLRTVIERAVARTRRVNPAVTIVIHGPSVEAAVRPVMLERAIANLVRNAVQVSADGGLVEVVLDHADGWAAVRVLDQGPGIVAADLPRLFDRFYRGQDARKRQGSGLGLAIVAQVADAHEGSIEAANRPEGGAAFTLRVPLEATPLSNFLGRSNARLSEGGHSRR